MPPTLRRETLPGAFFTGDEIFYLARDYLGFSWRLVSGGVAVLHEEHEVMVVESVQAARRTIVQLATGMIRLEFVDEVDLEHS